MSITFDQFLRKLDEANIAGSRPRPRGKELLTPAERARVSTRRDRTPIQRTGGGVSYVAVVPEPEPPKAEIKTPKRNNKYVQKWIPGFPAPKDLKVKPHKKTKLPKRQKRQKSPRPRTTQLKLKLKEFVDSYRQSIINS